MFLHLRGLVLLGLAGLLLSALPARAQFVEGNNPLLAVGQPVTLRAEAPDTVIVTYRPGSSIADTTRLTATTGPVTWTPTSAGIVQLSSPDAATRQTVSVRFETSPASGVFVLLLAGAILFGGAGFAFYRLTREEDPSPVI